ncbi:phage tail tape measure protein [Lactococcus raffinolactis]|uniref:phage tail tape measure protein n=1 Tax=Pseudolactococcus raffinolactis TaxID=1366 RepID=UPI001C70A4C2|nr:phage tail tape measure protein [Lactococcus raffinolactis]MBW9298298.1 phage tail tape measure protein [Lactococcus raffinolactis]
MAGATPLGNMVIKFSLDDTDFGRGVANSKKQVTYLAKEMSANMKIADLAGDKLGKLGNKYDGLTQIMKAQQGQVAALKKAYDESFVDGQATESTKRLAIQLQDANGKLAGYQGQLQNTAGQLARYKVETEGLTGSLNVFGDNAIANGKKLTAIGDGASKIGGALTKSVTIPLVAVGAAAVKASIDYESAFAGVKKTVNEQVDANGKVIISYDDLSNGIRSMAKEIPASASEIAAVAEVAGQLGIKTKDVLSFSKTMIDLGESTNLSATDAATAIAKIANITGMTSDEYRRFGSSVSALGNNFATTESDIVEMANRLASAGTLTGLTNQEILGLATSMSSVGIEAEAGGTAMTQTLTAIEQAAVSGGEQLDKFASIAGMSSEQFATTWKNKPIEAIQAFIKGLGGLDSKGESATLVLDEMGLSGVRQSNMLKSLALASDTMTSAVDTSNKAWSENTALTKEANTRYETTESKLKMLKNEVTDVAIEFGGPLVDALRDGVQAAKPVIQFLGDMAKKFSSLDKEQQQNIIKWGLIAASAGPALKIFGSITSVVGGTATNIGKLSKNLVGLAAKAAEKKAVASMAAEITTLGVSAASTSGALAGGSVATAGFATGLGAMLIPAGIAVGAIAAVGVAAYAGTKAYEAHQLAGAKWGTEVTKEQDKVITKSYELGNKAKADVAAYADGVKGSADDVFKSNNDIVDSIQKAIEKEAERRKKNAEKIEDPEARKRAEEYADYKAKLDQKTVDSAKVTVGNINKIMADASQNNRNLSTEEKNYIAENYRSLSDAQLKAAGFNKDQRIAIESAYQNDLNKLSDKQLQDRSENVMKGLDKEKTFYDKQKSYLKEVYGEGTESYKKEMTNLNKTNHKNTETMILGLARLTKAQGFSLENMSGAWEKYGWTTEEVAALVKNSTEGSSKEAENLGNILKTMDRDWDSVKLDPKTGKVTVEGKEDLIQSLLETDKWKDLTLDEKKLLVNGDEARIAFLDSATEANKWEQYQILAKEISVENRSAIQAILETQGGLDKWNTLQPDEKELLAKNDDLLKNVLTSEESLNAWRALPVETKQLLADSGNLYSVLMRSEEDMNKWKEIPDPIKKILGDNSSFIQTDSEAKAALSVWQNTPDAMKKLLGDNSNVMTAIFSSKENLDIWNRMPEEAKKLLGENQNFLSSKEGATAELQNWANNNPAPKSLDAINNTSRPVEDAKAKIVTLSGKTVYLYSDNQVADGVDAAKRKLAELPTYRGISIGIERVGGGEQLAGLFNAKGTNFHSGGDMIVNDQKGGLYKEIVQFPGQQPFIPLGRNVYIPDAPIGTKVYRASRTKSIMQRAGIPRYANGVGIPEDAQIIKNLRSIGDTQVKSDIKFNIDNSKVESRLDVMIRLFEELIEKDIIVTIDGEPVSKKLEQMIARRNAN